MQTKRILVVNPPAFTPKPYIEREAVFMGPYVLASNLCQNGYDCRVFDFITEKSYLDGWENNRIERTAKCGNYKNEFISKHVYYLGKNEKFYIDYLKAYKPNEVYISSNFTYNWQATQFVAQLTREFNPLIKISIGGIYVNLCLEHAKNNIDADNFIVTSCDDLNKFTKINISLYKSIPSTFPILTSIGCPFSCAWCAVSLLEGNKMIFQKPIDVVSDIEEKFYYGIKRFRFIDSNLLANYDFHLKIILKELLKRKINVELCSYGGINPLFVTQDMLELFAQSGFKNIQIPLESMNDDFLKENNRTVTSKIWKDVINKINKIKNFSVSSYFMCGFKHQTIKEIYQTMNFIKDCGAIPGPLFFTPIPKTKFEDNDILLENLHPYLFPYAHNDMKVEELEQILAITNNLGTYIPEYIKCKENNNNIDGVKYENKINM